MSGLRYIDVCSGISAPTMAWKPLGWEALCFAEIEAFPRAVLSHHYPDVPLNGDFTKIEGTEYGPVDLLVGGTPCQSFSVAGLRGGLGDDRGNLALEYLRLADRARPRWVVWENVPGVFSSLSHDAPDCRPPEIDLDAGNGPADGEEVVVEDSYDADESHALACFLAGLSELGYGWAYRVHDAQYAGVPQRRRRIFVVGYLGDWRRAAAVLFERHSLSGDTPPRRQAGQAAPTIPSRSTAGGGLGTDFDCDGGLVTFDRQSSGEYGTEPVASTVSARDYKGPSDLVAFAHQQGGTVDLHLASDMGLTLQKSQTQAICFTANDAVAYREVAGALTSNYGKQPDSSDTNLGPNLAGNGSAVRRLTPRECERLQGFPDNFTLVPYRGKPAADGPRYKALGNSMAVPVVRWIGERIQAVEAMSAAEAEAA